LLYFGYAERFGDDAYRHHAYLSVDAAEFLVERQATIVGTDTITPDFPAAHRSAGFDHLIHRCLLGHDVLIIEHLGPGLRDVAGRWMTLLAFPLRIVGGDGSPNPVMALVEE
jgi:kynurenine formamidase